MPDPRASLCRCKSGHQRRAATPQGIEVTLFVVRGSVFPATPGDTSPLGRQRTDRGVVAGPAVELLLIIGPRPVAEADRVTGPFMKRLPHEFRTGETEVD